MIFHESDLDDKELQVVEAIHDLKRQLKHALSAPIRWEGVLRRITFARALRGSNTIEGYVMTVSDAIAVATGEEPLDADLETWQAVAGYRRAMTYVLRLADDPHCAFSSDLIRSLHYMMLEHDPSKSPGQWRSGDIFVRDEAQNRVVYQGPEADLVPSLIAELISRLNEGSAGTPVVIRGAMAHLNLAKIHPFRDGNGRMARCLQSLVLARSGTLAPTFSSIEEYLGRNSPEYYRVLGDSGNRWTPERSTKSWIRFCLTAHFRQARTLLRRTERMRRIWDLLESEVGKRQIPDRTILALVDATLGYRVRNATYRPAAEISDALASRDLKALVDTGLLLPHGERRGRYYVASPVLEGIRQETRSDKQVEDPFQDQHPFIPGLGPND